MSPTISRRDFLKGASATLLALLLERQRQAVFGERPRQATAETPNVIVLVLDTLSAAHLPLYGYGRQTTPNLERFAGRSTVFHAHHAGGNFTTVGTASLITGAYPWTHRAFNYDGTVETAYRERNLFHAFSQKPYHKIA
jgi:arylsulfatase A-like enzyme